MKRSDKNQREIIEALRNIGASVFVTSNSGSRVASGFPDLVVGFRGKTFLLEVKDGSKPPSKQALSEAQKAFFYTWQGHVALVNSVDSAIMALGGISSGNRPVSESP